MGGRRNAADDRNVSNGNSNSNNYNTTRTILGDKNDISDKYVFKLDYSWTFDVHRIRSRDASFLFGLQQCYIIHACSMQQQPPDKNAKASEATRANLLLIDRKVQPSPLPQPQLLQTHVPREKCPPKRKETPFQTKAQDHPPLGNPFSTIARHRSSPPPYSRTFVHSAS